MKVVSAVLSAVRAKAAPGVSPRELDDMASDMIADAGAVSSFRGYHPNWAPGPYPAVTCISVNDAVVHGIPGRESLAPGDLLSVDFAVHLDRWCADAAFSVVVGDGADPRDLALIDATERALAAGIAAARRGREARRHLPRDRGRRAGRRIRDAGRPRWPRRRPLDARGPARRERGPSPAAG